MAALRVIGWFGRRNSGDEAFRKVHALLLPEVELSWLVHGSGYTPDVPLDDGLVLVSAGDIISPFYFDLIPPAARIVVYGVGLAWDEQLETLRRVRDRIVAVWVRNESDVEKVRALGIEAHYTPDIALLLHGAGDAAVAAPSGGRKRAIVTVTDNPRADALRRNDNARFMEVQVFAARLAEAMDYVGQYYDIEFMPFSFDRNDYDLASIHDIVPRMKTHEGVTVAEQELTPEQAIVHLRVASLVISTKFHGVIYALMNGTPFIAISNTRKVRLLCEEAGLADLYVRPDAFSAGGFKDALRVAEAPETARRIQQAGERLIAAAELQARRFRSTVLAELGRGGGAPAS